MKEVDYEYVPHNFVKRKFMAWASCQGCGLVSFNNPFTEWAIKKGVITTTTHPTVR